MTTTTGFELTGEFNLAAFTDLVVAALGADGDHSNVSAIVGAFYNYKHDINTGSCKPLIRIAIM